MATNQKHQSHITEKSSAIWFTELSERRCQVDRYVVPHLDLTFDRFIVMFSWNCDWKIMACNIIRMPIYLLAEKERMILFYFVTHTQFVDLNLALIFLGPGLNITPGRNRKKSPTSSRFWGTLSLRNSSFVIQNPNPEQKTGLQKAVLNVECLSTSLMIFFQLTNDHYAIQNSEISSLLFYASMSSLVLVMNNIKVKQICTLDFEAYFWLSQNNCHFLFCHSLRT